MGMKSKPRGPKGIEILKKPFLLAFVFSLPLPLLAFILAAKAEFKFVILHKIISPSGPCHVASSSILEKLDPPWFPDTKVAIIH